MRNNISLFILAYNEEENIEFAVADCVKTLENIADKYEVIIIDDASTDKTNEISRKLAKKYKNVRLIRNKRNKGFGGTQKVGYKAAKLDLITYVPGDYQVRIDALKAMLPHIKDCDIVVGRRRKRQDPWNRKLTAGVYNFGLRMMFGLKVNDIDSAKLIKKDVFKKVKIESESSNVDVEFMVKAKMNKFRIKEIDIKHYPRLHGKSTGNSLSVLLKQFRELFAFWLKFLFKW